MIEKLNHQYLSLCDCVMPSPYHLPTQLLQSPFPGNPFFFSKTYKSNCYNKFTRGSSTFVFIPKVTLITSNPTTVTPLHNPNLIEKHNGFPMEEDERESSNLDKKASSLQVQDFVDAIGAFPCDVRSIEILNIFDKNGGFGSISDFNDLLMALLITNHADLALKLYSNSSTYGLVPDSCTFGIIIRCYCKQNDVDEAKKVLDRMVENGLNTNVATFTVLINSFCKKGQLQKAFQILEAMGISGCSPNVQICNCLLKGLCYVGRVEDAFELMVDIKKSASIEPDMYTYNAMMDGFCKVGRSDEAMELLNEAVDMGLTPTVVTFNTLFTGYNKEGRPLEGISLLKQMKERNCMPDYISYRTLLHGLLLWGKINEAVEIYEEMLKNDFEVDERLMNSLVRGLCKKSLKENDLLASAYEVFEKMKERAFVIDHSTYGLVIQTLCMGNKAYDALINLQEMIRLGYLPRVFTINSLIRALCTEDKVEEACLVLVLMHENRKMLSRTSYDLLIHELNRQGRFLGACNVYSAALVRGMTTHKKPEQ